MSAEHEGFAFAREIIVFLAAAGLVVPVFHRLRVSPVLGYLLAGALIGPFGLGALVPAYPWLGYATIANSAAVRALAQLGVICMLFMIGLELPFARLWQLRRLVAGLGTAQIAVTAVFIGLVASAFGNSAGAAVLLGSCLALSSTAIVVQIMSERQVLATDLGRAGFSILLMQDLAVAPILIALAAVGAGAGGLAPAALVSFATALVAVAALYAAGRLALRPLFRAVAATRVPEPFVAAALLVAVGSASATHAAGLSAALGAFLGGVLLAETEYRQQIQVYIDPFKGLLLALFFMSVGMGIDLQAALAEGPWLAASVIGLMALKAAIAATLCLVFGLPLHVALPAGLLLAQAGEFSFVVIGAAVGEGILTAPVGAFLLAVASGTMFLTPPVAALAFAAEAALRRRRALSAGAEHRVPAPDEGHVIIAGFGRVGRTLAKVLRAVKQDFVAVDIDPHAVARRVTEGAPVFYGDASHIDMLRRLNAGRAAALVVTINDPQAATRVVRAARREWPRLPVFARAHHAKHAAALREAGASAAVAETLEAALQLAEQVLATAGYTEDAARQLLEERRMRERGLAGTAGRKGESR